jgi:hypothetical protein
VSEDRFERFERGGRPKLEKEEQRTKKVLLSYTEKEYEELKRMQTILGKNTLTATIQHFVDRGIEKTKEDFMSAFERDR